MDMESRAATHTDRRVKHSLGDRTFYSVGYIVTGLLTLVVLMPMMYVVAASFSSGAAVASGKVWLWPVDFTLYNYETVLKYSTIWLGYRNTIFYTVFGTLINITITMAAAYPLARKTLKGKGLVTALFSFTMIFSGGMIPSYILIRDLGMMNTIWAMLLPGALSVYNMIVARTFIASTISDELLEAAKIDGCSDVKFFIHIVLPLSKAIIAVLAIWYGVGHWNSYFNAFLYLNDRNLYPLQIFLRQILIQSSGGVADVMDEEMLAQMQNIRDVLKYAVIVISTVPLMCFYPFVQRHFVKGVMIGSIKG